MDKKSRLKNRLRDFQKNYARALGLPEDTLTPAIERLSEQILLQEEHPYSFEPYHKKVRSPVDYHKIGLDIVDAVIDYSRSRVEGLPTLQQIEKQLAQGENVILFANHQTETDPPIIAALLNTIPSVIADKIIYVAGDRVLTDPIAIPFSMGCDLLCIYSKRYIDNPPELKAQKMFHNKNTMEQLRCLLEEGGKIIYVAPSGGRDRKDENGIPQVAAFDPNSIEMISLMARKAGTPTHFYPFALSTYFLFPPPEIVQTELGEERLVNRAPARIAFAPEFNMEKFPGSEDNDKQIRKQSRAQAIWRIVHDMHEKIRC